MDNLHVVEGQSNIEKGENTSWNICYDRFVDLFDLQFLTKL